MLRRLLDRITGKQEQRRFEERVRDILDRNCIQSALCYMEHKKQERQERSTGVTFIMGQEIGQEIRRTADRARQMLREQWAVWTANNKALFG